VFLFFYVYDFLTIQFLNLPHHYYITFHMFRSCIVTVQTTSVEQKSAHFKADMVFLFLAWQDGIFTGALVFNTFLEVQKHGLHIATLLFNCL